MSEYQIASCQDSEALAEFLAKDGQLLLPMLDLITGAEAAVDELIDMAGRATVEAILKMSAEAVAGPKHPGKRGGEIRRHGQQPGVVPLAERKLRVQKPRLRRKGAKKGAEVEVPAYTALLGNSRLGTRMLEIMMRGVSTRNYQEVLPRMAETVGVSKSNVSREFIEASAETLRQLGERRFDDLDILVIYLDGLVFGKFHVLAAIGVDGTGKKHVLGLKEGGSENTVVATALLEDLVAHGVKPGRHRLFVIDGSQALRLAINAVYGDSNPVQRCRRHKERNVQGYLPDDQAKRMLLVMRAAWKLPADQGIAKLEEEAKYLEKSHPSAAASLREGLKEMFTVNRLGLPSTLSRCLCSTNIIESCFSGGRDRTHRVTNWQSGDMALRWSASALLETEKKFRHLMGHKQLWMLKAHLDRLDSDQQVAEEREVG